MHLRFAQTDRTYPIAGYLIVNKNGPAAALARNLVAMSLEQVLKLVHKGIPSACLSVGGGMLAGYDTLQEEVSRIDIYVTKRHNVERVRASVLKVIGGRAGVQTPEQAAKSTDDAISSIKIGLSLCSAGAMVVGLFLVYNSLSVSVAERRHDIGVLRLGGRNQGANS